MNFQELTITIADPQQIDSISELLEENGADAITMQDAADQPILEPQPQTTPLWQNTNVTALFQDSETFDAVLALLKVQFPALHYTVKTVADQNWIQNSVADFKPVCFAGNLWVHPSWELPPADAKVTLQLDPGIAFGTGTHPTTAMCLTWLAEQDLTQKTVIDYGCGSGILAIAALKLGAQSVWAVDIDQQALQASKNNATLNNISPTDLHIDFPEQLPPIKVELLIANILAKPLLELAETFVNFLKPGGMILLTGILNTQEEQILEHYKSYCSIKVIKRINEWSLLGGSLLN